MRLSRDKIQRMIDAGGGRSSGGGGGSDIAGGVTQAWVNQNYVSIEFFRRVFKVWAAGETSSDPDVEIMPNDIASTVKNIQAQAGLWTEAFLSALGQGSGGGTGGATTLDQLDDVVITSPTNGQALIYNATTQMWVNGTIQSGTDMATVWSALAAATSEQINASHLSGVLADYVTTTSLQTILGDYLTQTAADQRYITIAYFDRLFRAYNGSTLVSHNDTTTTIDNIKAMFGFWTELYISALGRNSAATGLGIDNLTDVTINTPTDGQVLQYNATSSKWENATIQTVVALSGLTDVLLTSVSSNQILIYDATTQKWVNSSVKTINGYSIFGTGDIPASGGGTGNYLPLAGGTMTGDIRFSRNVAIRDTSGNLLFKQDADNYQAITVGSGSVNTPILLNNNISFFIIGTSGLIEAVTRNDAEFFISLNNSDTSRYIFNKTWFGPSGNSAGRISLGRFDYRWNYLYAQMCHVWSDNADLITLRRKSSNGGAFIDYYANNQTSNKWRIGASSEYYALFEYNGASKMILTSNAYLGIGTTPSYALHVSGTIYATGAITALSDARKKDITGVADVSVEQIAHAPAVQFLWKDKERRKDGQQVGTLAQYWQTVLPEVVMDKGGELSMQYGVAALVSAITIARKVVDHEQRITELEKENERLRTEIEQLRLN